MASRVKISLAMYRSVRLELGGERFRSWWYLTMLTFEQIRHTCCPITRHTALQLAPVDDQVSNRSHGLESCYLGTMHTSISTVHQSFSQNGSFKIPLAKGDIYSTQVTLLTTCSYSVVIPRNPQPTSGTTTLASPSLLVYSGCHECQNDPSIQPTLGSRVSIFAGPIITISRARSL